MIIKGGQRAGGGLLATHLGRADTNETVELVELRGVAAPGLDGALREIEAVASGTKCRQPLYHANINTAGGDAMTPDRWMQAADRLEQALGLNGQARAIVRHVKEGREHLHVVWSRITDDMKAITMSHNYRIHEEVSRALEQEFGHRHVEGVHTGDKSKPRPVAEANRAEQQQAEDGRGLPVKQARHELTAAWDATFTGQEFAEKITEQGYILAQGDERDFIIMDRLGGIHSPRRRIVGMKAADIKARFADIDPKTLPTQAEAKSIIGERMIEGVAAPVAEPETKQPKEQTATPTPAPASSNAAWNQQADQAQKGTEAGLGLLEKLFTRVAELFDTMRDKLFGGVLDPEGQETPQQQTPPAKAKPPALVPVEVVKVTQPERRQLKPYEKRNVPAHQQETTDRALDHEGRERSREIEWEPPPDDEPDGGGE